MLWHLHYLLLSNVSLCHSQTYPSVTHKLIPLLLSNLSLFYSQTYPYATHKLIPLLLTNLSLFFSQTYLSVTHQLIPLLFTNLSLCDTQTYPSFTHKLIPMWLTNLIYLPVTHTLIPLLLTNLSLCHSQTYISVTHKLIYLLLTNLSLFYHLAAKLSGVIIQPHYNRICIITRNFRMRVSWTAIYQEMRRTCHRRWDCSRLSGDGTPDGSSWTLVSWRWCSRHTHTGRQWSGRTSPAAANRRKQIQWYINIWDIISSVKRGSS